LPCYRIQYTNYLPIFLFSSLLAERTGPVLVTPLTADISTHEGQPLKLTAKVTPEPGLTINWCKNGSPLKADHHVKLTSNKDGTQTLTVRSVNNDDNGEYSITFVNDIGETVSTSKVFVDKKPKSPVFKKRLPATSTTIEGDDIEFNVAVEGHPKPTVQWTFKGADIPDDSNIKIEEIEDGKYKVQVKNCQLSDHRSALKCVATNASGSVNCSTNLTVKVGPPKVTLHCDETALVDPGTDAVFKIEIPSDGAKYKVDWWKGTKPIFRSTKKFVLSNEGLFYSFTVVDPQDADKGLYKCVIAGPGGKTTKEFNVDIKG